MLYPFKKGNNVSTLLKRKFPLELGSVEKLTLDAIVFLFKQNKSKPLLLAKEFSQLCNDP